MHESHTETGQEYGRDIRQPGESVGQNRIGDCPYHEHRLPPVSVSVSV